MKTLVVLGAIGASGWLWATVDRADDVSLSHRLMETMRTQGRVNGMSVWLLFSPANCDLRIRHVNALKQVRERTGAAITAVMLQPPPGEDEIAALRKAFAMDFPVVLDRTSGWRDGIQRGGHRIPTVAVLRGDEVRLVASLDLLDALAEGDPEHNHLWRSLVHGM